MDSLEQFLQEIPYKEIRGMATRLGIRQRGQERKEVWVTAITELWQTPERAQAIAKALSSPAQAALYQLWEAEQLPAALFWTDYGTIRRYGQQEAEIAAPWVEPLNVSEELYYIGLLHPVEGNNIERATFVTTPLVLRPLLTTAPADPIHETVAWPLLHDLGQYLIYIHQSPHQHLLHGRWLAPSHLKALNRRLHHPEAAPLPRSHKQAPWLSFLAFLAQATQLTTTEGISAYAWQWLDAAPEQQLMRLWQGWQDATPGLRHRYNQAVDTLPAPWPRPLLRLLAQQPQSFSAPQLAAHLLGTSNQLYRYFVAHLEDTQELSQFIESLLAFDLRHLGVVQRIEATQSEPVQNQNSPLYRLTATGAWLLHPMLAAPRITPIREVAIATARWSHPDRIQMQTHAPFGYELRLPNTLSGRTQATLAGYGDYIGFAINHTPPCHIYVLQRDSMASAAAADRPLSTLQTLLAQQSLLPTPEQWSQLQQWYETGQQLRLVQLPLLQSIHSDEMAMLWRDRNVRVLFGELLSPTTR